MWKVKFNEWIKDIVEHKFKIFLALLFCAFSILALALSSHYVDDVNTIAVPDLILDHLPVVDLTFLFVWGIIFVVTIYIAYSLFFKPRKFHYTIGMLSLFLLVRSIFIILTHLKAPVGAIIVETPHIFRSLTYANDLFFSGHAGFPFLGFLIFENKILKYFMLISSIILAMTVLLMHVHYSIDVASAYFITYGVYVLGNKIFGDASDFTKNSKEVKV